MSTLASLRARLKRIEQQRASLGESGPLARVPTSELVEIMYRESDPELADRAARLFDELGPQCSTEQELLSRVFNRLYADSSWRPPAAG